MHLHIQSFLFVVPQRLKTHFTLNNVGTCINQFNNALFGKIIFHGIFFSDFVSQSIHLQRSMGLPVKTHWLTCSIVTWCDGRRERSTGFCTSTWGVLRSVFKNRKRDWGRGGVGPWCYHATMTNGRKGWGNH